MKETSGGKELSINRGVELMLRGVKKKPKTRGLFLDKFFTLHKKEFFFKLEIGWRSID